jgi:thioredoxin-like negative regulator of GroEL
VIEQILQADRYLQVDQVERARDAYQKVVDLDPGNAMAVVGLARCALAEGEDREAHALASRALLIDPENDMARRMEARLSEILATRGETVERPVAAATPGPREMRPLVTEERQADGMPAAASELAPSGVDSPARPEKPAPTRTKEPLVRKSLFDRLLGR